MKITDDMIQAKVDEIYAELEKLSFDPMEITDDSKIWEFAERQLEASLDEYYDNRYEQMKEERAGIC